MDNIKHPLHNWIPYKLSYNNGQALCHWLNTFDKRFNEPFFDETVSKCKGLLRLGTYRESVSDVLMVKDWVEDLDYVAPTAFIFHVSRCGSTMISQLFGLDERNISLAEVPFFDDILRSPYKNDAFDNAEVNSLLQAAIKFYGQKRTGQEDKLFIKTDSWHIAFWQQLRALYPDVPFVLLYRSPDEVLASHIKHRGMHAVQGIIEPEVYGFDPEGICEMDINHYAAKVLERYFELYLEVAENDNNCLLLNYSEGIMPMMQKIAGFCNIAISEEQLIKMQERSGYHSKHPGKVFAEEQTKQVPGYLDKAMQLYEAVEVKRIIRD